MTNVRHSVTCIFLVIRGLIGILDIVQGHLVFIVTFMREGNDEQCSKNESFEGVEEHHADLGTLGRDSKSGVINSEDGKLKYWTQDGVSLDKLIRQTSGMDR